MHKINLVLECEMERVDMICGEVVTAVPTFASKTEIVLPATDVGELYNKATDKISGLIAMYQMRGSHWRFKSVQRLTINTIIYKPLKGKSYIPLTKRQQST